MSQKTIQLSFFVILTLGLFLLSFLVFKPYLGVIFLAIVLAVSFHPLYKKILFKFNGRKNPAALSTLLIIVVCIVIPVILLSASLLNEAIDLYNGVAFGGSDNILLKANGLIQDFKTFLPSSDMSSQINVENYARDLLDWIIGHFDSVFAAVFGGLFKFILMLLSLYYLLIYGDKIRKEAVAWSPLPDYYDEEFLTTLRASVDAVMQGRLLVSVAQGLFIGIGFAIFGVDNPVLWGFVGGIASLIPILGTSIITVPAAVYLFLSGSVGAAIGMLVWSTICVGLIDNVLSFFFFKNKIKVHPIIILFSILGGVEFFGTIGFLVGPVVVSAFLAIMKIYPFIMSRWEEQKI